MAKLVYGLNQSLDGYVDHQEFATWCRALSSLRRANARLGRQCVRSPHVRGRFWDEDRPEWSAEERDFAAA